jgi:hypothetical protein
VGSLVTDYWYADDGYIVAASFPHLQTDVTELRDKLAEVGLSLNVRKSMVLPSPGVRRAMIPDRMSSLAGAVPEGDAISCLGVPVGDPTECERRVEGAM